MPSVVKQAVYYSKVLACVFICSLLQNRRHIILYVGSSITTGHRSATDRGLAISATNRLHTPGVFQWIGSRRLHPVPASPTRHLIRYRSSISATNRLHSPGVFQWIGSRRLHLVPASLTCYLIRYRSSISATNRLHRPGVFQWIGSRRLHPVPASPRATDPLQIEGWP